MLNKMQSIEIECGFLNTIDKFNLGSLTPEMSDELLVETLLGTTVDA